MLCSALTTKGNPCKHDHASGRTHQGADGWVYYLCQQHFDMIQNGREVNLDKNPARGHAPLQPQLDMSNPVHSAWATKEKTMITTEMIAAMEDVHEDQDLIDIEANMDRETYVVVYGHRPSAFRPEEKDIALTLLGRVLHKLDGQYDNLTEVCGGADGADRWGAKAAVVSEVPFIIMAPHEGYFTHYHQGKVWVDQMKEAARSVNYVHPNEVPFHWSMNFSRNEAMADMGEIFVLVSPHTPQWLLNQRRGGTTHMTKTIKAKGVERIIHVNPRTNVARWVTL